MRRGRRTGSSSSTRTSTAKATRCRKVRSSNRSRRTARCWTTAAAASCCRATEAARTALSATAAVIGADTLDGLRLSRALKAGILRLLSRQEHLNKINVFPVPDGDTGTNLALTMSAVLGVLQKAPDPHVGQTLTRVADAALDGARGNSGAILAQFFLGLCDRLGHLGRLSAADFAAGVRGGADYARESLS